MLNGGTLYLDKEARRKPWHKNQTIGGMQTAVVFFYKLNRHI